MSNDLKVLVEGDELFASSNKDILKRHLFFPPVEYVLRLLGRVDKKGSGHFTAPL